MYKRIERQITAAVTPLLEPGETLEVVTFAAIGGPSFKKTAALGAPEEAPAGTPA